MAKEKKQKEIKEVVGSEDSKKEKKKKNNIEKQTDRAKKIRILKIGLLSLSLFLAVTYIVLKVLNETGDFTVTLGDELSRGKGIVMYESINDKEEKKVLGAQSIEEMDNISINWIPENIDSQSDGSHNGDNYMAYTFYIEHMGLEAVNYWYSVHIDEVFRNIDEAIRVMVFLNGERTVYAKLNGSGNPEARNRGVLFRR